MNARTQPKLTLEQYLAWEEGEPERHEYHRGEVYAMVGARRVHACVVDNLRREFGNRLKGTPCRVFGESAKLQIGDDTVLYPDVFVTCDRADLATELIFRSPTLVVEVLSPSSQAYDRSAKFALYRRIATLAAYILVDPDTRRVEAFRRNDRGEWVLHDMSEGDALEAASIGCRIALAEVFEGVEPLPGT
jgi:Uma2 family endonuclease